MSTRLELIKLVYRHDQRPSELVARATELEAYVKSDPSPEKGKGGWPKGKPRKGQQTSESPADTQEQTER